MTTMNIRLSQKAIGEHALEMHCAQFAYLHTCLQMTVCVQQLAIPDMGAVVVGQRIGMRVQVDEIVVC